MATVPFGLPEGAERLYRYNDNDRLLDEYTGQYDRPHLEEYEVLRRTECGAWIKCEWKERFVLNTASGGRRRFAYATKEEAARSFLIRKQRAVGHKRRELKKQESMLEYAEALTK